MRRGEPQVLVVVLAGGQGERLLPLTAERAKPAVPFGGIYRLIDFALSNVINSGYRKVLVLTQYKSHSLDVHISQTWPAVPMLGSYVAVVPAQQRVGKSWYLGSADAIFQSLNVIEDEQPDLVVVVSADHVYRMDFSQMVAAHLSSGADMTVAALTQPSEQAHHFGVIDVDSRDPAKMVGFTEKPTDAAPGQVLASMGNYIFTTAALLEAVRTDHDDPGTGHDIGADIVPRLVRAGNARVYNFQDNEVPGASPRDRAYWRDVGTLDSYYEAHRDLTSVHPVFNLYNWDWPIHTNYGALPPAKFVHGDSVRAGVAINSAVSPGVIISGGHVSDSVIGPQTHVHSYAQVSESVIMNRVEVGQHARIHRAIIDKQVTIPDGTTIGIDHDLDRARGMTVTPGGITVVSKGARVLPDAHLAPDGSRQP